MLFGKKLQKQKKSFEICILKRNTEHLIETSKWLNSTTLCTARSCKRKKTKEDLIQFQKSRTLNYCIKF